MATKTAKVKLANGQRLQDKDGDRFGTITKAGREKLTVKWDNGRETQIARARVHGDVSRGRGLYALPAGEQQAPEAKIEGDEAVLQRREYE